MRREGGLLVFGCCRGCGELSSSSRLVLLGRRASCRGKVGTSTSSPITLTVIHSKLTIACMKLPLLGMDTDARRACRISSIGIVRLDPFRFLFLRPSEFDLTIGWMFSPFWNCTRHTPHANGDGGGGCVVGRASECFHAACQLEAMSTNVRTVFAVHTNMAWYSFPFSPFPFTFLS